MRRITFVLSTILLGLIFVQCDRDRQMGNQHMEMGDQQMEQMMQNPEMRRGMMQRMAENPDMRREMMSQMRAGMGQMDQDAMLDHMQSMMEDPEQRQRMLSHVQQMQEMLENEEFDREQMRQMMEGSPMMGMHMRCMQMMQGPGSEQSQD